MKNLLSIDFDFFVRENPMWDWGHSETNKIFHNVAWHSRYATNDVYTDCDIDKYANFFPEFILLETANKGFHLKKDFNLYVADSHKEAYKVLEKLGKCRVYNLDAHHDLYDGKELDCGNWLTKGFKRGLVEEAFWIAPDWGTEFEMLKFREVERKKYGKKLTLAYYNDFLVNKTFDDVFVCRSSSWVPPHCDERFATMIRRLALSTKNVEMLDTILVRTPMSREDAQKVYKEFQENFKQFKKQQEVSNGNVKV